MQELAASSSAFWADAHPRVRRLGRHVAGTGDPGAVEDLAVRLQHQLGVRTDVADDRRAVVVRTDVEPLGPDGTALRSLHEEPHGPVGPLVVQVELDRAGAGGGQVTTRLPDDTLAVAELLGPALRALQLVALLRLSDHDGSPLVDAVRADRLLRAVQEVVHSGGRRDVDDTARPALLVELDIGRNGRDQAVARTCERHLVGGVVVVHLHPAFRQGVGELDGAVSRGGDDVRRLVVAVADTGRAVRQDDLGLARLAGTGALGLVHLRSRGHDHLSTVVPCRRCVDRVAGGHGAAAAAEQVALLGSEGDLVRTRRVVGRRRRSAGVRQVVGDVGGTNRARRLRHVDRGSGVLRQVLAAAVALEVLGPRVALGDVVVVPLDVAVLPRRRLGVAGQRDRPGDRAAAVVDRLDLGPVVPGAGLPAVLERRGAGTAVDVARRHALVVVQRVVHVVLVADTRHLDAHVLSVSADRASRTGDDESPGDDGRGGENDGEPAGTTAAAVVWVAHRLPFLVRLVGLLRHTKTPLRDPTLVLGFPVVGLQAAHCNVVSTTAMNWLQPYFVSNS